MSCSLTITSLAILSLVFLAVTDINVKCDFYVSTNGNDTTGNGTIGRPFHTIEQSLDKAKNVSILSPIVCLREGTHSSNLTNYLPGNLTIFSVDGPQRANLHLTIMGPNNDYNKKRFYYFIGLLLTNLSIEHSEIYQITIINSTCDTTDISATSLILSDCDFQGKTSISSFWSTFSPYYDSSIIIQKCNFKYISKIEVEDYGQITIQECYFQYSSNIEAIYGQITLQESQIVGLVDPLHLYATVLIVQDCLFDNNTNGVIWYRSYSTKSNVTIQNCSFTDNTKSVLNIIYTNYPVIVTIQNCSFSDNTDGVLFFQNNVESLTIQDCTFTDNSIQSAQASIIDLDMDHYHYSPISFIMDNCKFSCPKNEDWKPVIWVDDQHTDFSRKFNSISIENCDPQCSPGTFSIVDLTSCFDCPVGTYSNTSNAQECSECNGGSWSDSGEDHCTYCSPGSFRPSYLQRDCEECPDGFAQPNSGGTTCNLCDPGFKSDYSHIKCIQCEAGTAKNKDQNDCIPCKAGTFSNHSGAIDCSKCPPGYTSKIGDIWCTKCLSGQYQPYWGGTSCLTCPHGEISKIGASVCQPCPSGSITFTFGNNTLCVDCIPGSYSNASDEGSLCLMCPPGTYSNVRASSCLSCPSGTYQPASGAGFCFYCNGISTRTECNPCSIWLDGQNCSNLSFVTVLLIVGGVLIAVGLALFACMRNEIKYTELMVQ